MSKDHPPQKPDSNELRADIKRLSKQSEILRETAEKNARQADMLVQRVKEIQRHLGQAASRKAKRTSGRIG